MKTDKGRVSNPKRQFLKKVACLRNLFSHTTLPAIMQYSFLLAPLLSSLSAFRMYLIAAGSVNRNYAGQITVSLISNILRDGGRLFLVFIQ
jgi:hypothetical protein